MPQRLTLQQAAERLGISLHTARRMARDGRLQVETERIPQGHRYWVLLPDEPPPSSAASGVTEASTATDAVPQALYDQVVSERDWLRQQVEELVRQGENYQVLLREAQAARQLTTPMKVEVSRAAQDGGQRPSPGVPSMDTTAPEPTADLPAGSEPVNALAADLARALKQAGVKGKKARRQLVGRLTSLWGR
jgi:hypothetical protein